MTVRLVGALPAAYNPALGRNLVLLIGTTLSFGSVSGRSAGQRLEGRFLFGVIGVAIMSPSHPANDMPKAPLGVIGIPAPGSSANGWCDAGHAGSSR